MDDSDNKTNQINEERSINKYWREFTGILLASFLGGFLAMYFVADQVFDKHHNYYRFKPDKFEREMLRDFDKMYEAQRKAFDDDFNKFDSNFNNGWFDNAFEDFNSPDRVNKNDNKIKKLSKKVLNPFLLPDMTTDSVKIKSEYDNNEYKVIIGLKAFNGDESKINYMVSGRKLTVFGSSKFKDKKYEQDISFSQDFILPFNADIANIVKKKDGNNLVIEVPLKD